MPKLNSTPSHSNFDRCAVPCHAIESIVIDAENPAKHCHRIIFFPVSYNSIGTTVVGLLNVCNPTTIIRRVIAIVSYSLKRMLRTRGKSHIRQKIFKGVKPTLANFYPSCAIVFVSLALFITTSGFHICPGSPFFRACPSMFGTVSSCVFFLIAFAGCCMAGAKIKLPYHYFISAFASAQPFGFIVKNKSFNQSQSAITPFHFASSAHNESINKKPVTGGLVAIEEQQTATGRNIK